MSAERLPARLEVSGLLRQVQAAGGFGMVIASGEPDAGAIIVVIQENGHNARAYERMPALDGTRPWHCARRHDPAAAETLDSWLDRRRQRDPDLWIVELDIANGERFIGLSPPSN